MSVTLVGDPIVSEQLVLDTLALSGDKARMYINAVSGMFLRFTNRSRINKGATVDKEIAPPPSEPVVWLRATPVDEVTSIKLVLGSTETTLTADEYTLNEDTGRLVLQTHVPGYPSPNQVVVSTYTGGWEEVPGEIQQTALEMIKLQHARLTGRIGIMSESREGYSASYDQAAVPQPVADVWRRYKVY
jgi:hypothetical protein